MAKKDTRIGPTDAGVGMNPPNPSDRIVSEGVPIRHFPSGIESAGVIRRPFSEPTRNPLHYLDGPGTDERVTSRRYQPPQTIGAFSADVLDHTDYDQGKFGPEGSEGRDRPGNENTHTLNGVEIRGT